MTKSKHRDTMLKLKHTSVKKAKSIYLMKGEWHATAKLFRVTAKDEDTAFVKAARGEGRGCLNLKLIRQVN